MKTGNLAIASIHDERVPKFYFKDIEIISNTVAVFPGQMGVAYWQSDNLLEYCISDVGRFNDKILEKERISNRRVEDMIKKMQNEIRSTTNE